MKLHQPRNFQLLILFVLGSFICGSVVRGQVPTPSPQSAPLAVQPPALPTAQTVRLNVIVTDMSGEFVADLRQEDFRVEEDGVPQTITHFAREVPPVSYAIVVDNTGSLRDRLNNLLWAGGILISANQPGDETMLVRFVSTDNISMVQDFTGNQAALIQGLSSMYVEGGQSAIIDAVYMSAERVGERRKDELNRRRALVLLTDGEDRLSYYKLDELKTLLRKTDVQVFAIGLLQNLDAEGGFTRKSAKDNAVKLLDTLTQETGGRAFYPKKPQGLKDVITEISNYLRMQYVIGYQPTNSSRDGKFRKVQVKLNEPASGAKRNVRTRPGYFALGAKVDAKPQSKENAPRLKSP